MPPAPAASSRIVRHTLVARRLEVCETISLNPQMQRIVFTGEALRGFISPAPDDHVRLFFPNRHGEFVLPQPSVTGPRYLAGAEPSPSRDYTPLAYDAVRRRLSIDFLLHGSGLASDWAAQAQPGQSLCIAGPRASTLIEATPADGWVLAGDETALPALARWLQYLPPPLAVQTLIEIDKPVFGRYLPPRAGMQLQWLERRAHPPGHCLQTALLPLATQWPHAFFWIAGESRAVRSIRRQLEERGIARDSIRASGYWTRSD